MARRKTSKVDPTLFAGPGTWDPVTRATYYHKLKATPADSTKVFLGIAVAIAFFGLIIWAGLQKGAALREGDYVRAEAFDLDGGLRIKRTKGQ